MKATNIPPSDTEQSSDSSLRLLSAAKHGHLPPVVAGFDGFVDTILHAFAERRSSTEYSRLTTLKAFSAGFRRKASCKSLGSLYRYYEKPSSPNRDFWNRISGIGGYRQRPDPRNPLGTIYDKF